MIITGSFKATWASRLLMTDVILTQKIAPSMTFSKVLNLPDWTSSCQVTATFIFKGQVNKNSDNFKTPGLNLEFLYILEMAWQLAIGKPSRYTANCWHEHRQLSLEAFSTPPVLVIKIISQDGESKYIIKYFFF